MNVIGTRPDGWWKDRHAAMERLVGLLESWAAVTGDDITVVFERAPSPPIRSERRRLPRRRRRRPRPETSPSPVAPMVSGATGSIADVDAAFRLQLNDMTRRLEDCLIHRGRIHRLVPAEPSEHLAQRPRPEQASRMGRQDSFVRSFHRDVPPLLPRRVLHMTGFAHSFNCAARRRNLAVLARRKVSG